MIPFRRSHFKTYDAHTETLTSAKPNTRRCRALRRSVSWKLLGPAGYRRVLLQGALLTGQKLQFDPQIGQHVGPDELRRRSVTGFP